MNAVEELSRKHKDMTAFLHVLYLFKLKAHRRRFTEKALRKIGFSRRKASTIVRHIP